MSKLSERLQELKVNRNLLQKDIAQDNQLSLRAYQYYERGEREPTASVIIRLCQYFQVSSDYLLGLSDSKERLP